MAWHSSVAESPSTFTMSAWRMEARGGVGARGPPSTFTSTRASAVPSLFSALQTYTPASAGPAASTWRGEGVGAQTPETPQLEKTLFETHCSTRAAIRSPGRYLVAKVLGWDREDWWLKPQWEKKANGIPGYSV